MIKDWQQRKWAFGLLWIIANTFGWGIYILIGFAVGWIVWQAYQDLNPYYGHSFYFLTKESNRILIAFVISSIGWGAIVGFLQKLVIRRCFKLELKGWILATIIGLLLYETVCHSYVYIHAKVWIPVLSPYISYMCALIAPLMLGVAQWFVLRRYCARSGWWIVATMASLWLSAFTIQPYTTYAPGYDGNLVLTFIGFPLEGLIYGIATSVVLTIIPRR